MADIADGSSTALVSKWSRLKPEIYRTFNGKVIVEDEVLDFLAVKLKL